MNRILLAYSGSLATTAAIPWLREAHGADVITLTLDLGQGLELADVRERALSAGALRAHVIDARDEFVRDHILPALRAGRAASPDAFAGRPLSRALLAKRLVDVARMESATAIAHGCAATDPDRVVLEEQIRALNPALAILAPAADSGMVSDDLEVNLWGRTLLRPAAAADFRLTRSTSDAPDHPALMDVEILDGVPVRTNGVDMSTIEMIESIETIAGTHGVGRIAIPGGFVAESPAAVVLQSVYSALMDRQAGTLPNGLVRVKLFKGACEVVGVLEPKAAH
jgi:argininosuccinate synthase